MNEILTQSTITNGTVIRTRIERTGLRVEYLLEVSLFSKEERVFIMCKKSTTTSKMEALKLHMDKVSYHSKQNLRSGLVKV